MIQLTIGEYTGHLILGRYAINDRISISLIKETGGRIGTLTTNLVDLPCGEDEFYLNSNHNFGENIDLLEILENEGLVKDTLGEYESGFCTYPRCIASEKLLKELKI